MAVDGQVSSWVDGEQVYSNGNGPVDISYTSGTINTAFTGTGSSTKHIGGTANNYVCGEVFVAKPAYQSEDDLKLTIK